jgi:hypothetical protein
MGTADFNSEESLYAWGLCLYAIFKGLLVTQTDQLEKPKEIINNEE